ncbi:MAG: hypothetical protein JW708_12325 [Vallitaleaceae bacterium]|nr:hypothetical protein [Vallitaleaceae bacterium]
MKKKEFVDDGRTVVSMDFDRVPYRTSFRKGTKQGLSSEKANAQVSKAPPIQLTKKEQRAIAFGAMQAILPIIVYFVVAYFLVFLLLDIFWVN